MPLGSKHRFYFGVHHQRSTKRERPAENTALGFRDGGGRRGGANTRGKEQKSCIFTNGQTNNKQSDKGWIKSSWY